MSANQPGHRWTFFRRGGLNQAALLTTEDILALPDLDLKLWVALACPSQGLECDPRTLALLDADGDGRIRPAELIAAVQWAATQLKDPADLLHPSETLPLDSVQDHTAAGLSLLEAARRVLNDIGMPNATEIGLDALAEPQKIFRPGQINGEGVIPPEAATDGDTAQLIKDIAGVYGAAKGPAGTEGVTPAMVEQFFNELEEFCAWASSGPVEATSFLGDKTEGAYAAVAAVRAKVDDYFTRCRVAAFDHRAQPAMNRPQEDFAPLAGKILSPSTPELAGFPLAHIGPGRPLPLGSGVNPAWSDAVATLRSDAVTPVFGSDKTELTEAEWTSLVSRFAPYEAWLKTKPEGKAQGVGLPRALEILGGKGKPGLTALLARDAELGPAYEAFGELERLIRYRRDLFTLLHNFVNFADFYSKDRWAIFQAGTLYLDSRSCELCVRVSDPAAHSTLANLSLVCIAYCECKRAGSPNLAIAACFTQGDSDYLYVGRNGVFYDRQGNEWDATIVKLLDNPISLRQAFLAPYKKFMRFIEEQVAKRAAASQPAGGGAIGAVASGTRKIDVGTVAALGVAVGGITSAMGIIFASIVGLKAWIPVGIIGILALISGPSVLIAWLKLRERTLGPILEASGWAINGRIHLTMPLGHALTELAHLPAGSVRRLRDPYADRSGRWLWIVLLIVALLVGGGLYAAHVRHVWPFGPAPWAHALPARK